MTRVARVVGVSVSDSVVISQGASRVLLKISYSYTDNPICYSYVCKHLQETIFVIVLVLATKKQEQVAYSAQRLHSFFYGGCMHAILVTSLLQFQLEGFAPQILVS